MTLVSPGLKVARPLPTYTRLWGVEFGRGLRPLPDTGAPPVWDYRAVVPTGILPDYTAYCSGPGFPATLNKTQRSRSC